MPNKTYAIRAVTGCKFFPEEDLLKYHIDWMPRPNGREYPRTFEPLENIAACPILLHEYEKRVYKVLQQSEMETYGMRKVPITEFLQASGTDMRKKMHPIEYVPNGKEFVRKIYSTWEEETCGLNLQYYWVKFHTNVNLQLSDTLHVVRRPYIDYYFPLDAIKFHNDVF